MRTCWRGLDPPRGLLGLLNWAKKGIALTDQQQAKLTLSAYSQPV